MKYAIAVILLGSACGAMAQYPPSFQVHFNSGSAILGREAMNTLDSIAVTFHQGNIGQVEVIGHTDTRGPVDSNLRLSKARSMSVMEGLLQRGLLANNISVAQLGEAQPLNSERDVIELSANRRVTIFLRPYSGQHAIDATMNQGSIDGDPAPRTIKPSITAGDTVITGPLGTRLRMPKDIFCEDMSTVRFEVDEIPGIGEMMLKDLPTETADGQCLASGGVLRLRATVNGQEVQPCDGKAIEVFVPSEKPDTAMELYTLRSTAQGELWEHLPTAKPLTTAAGYTFRMPRLIPVNIDKVPIAGQVAGAIAKLRRREKGLVIRSRKMDYERSYLASPAENMAVKGRVFKPRKARFKPCALRMDAMFMGIFRQDGRIFLVNKALLSLKYRRLTNRYVVRKRDYEQVTEAELKARLLSIGADSDTGQVR